MKDFDVKFFRALAAVEGASLAILLFVAMPMKHFFGDPSWVRAVGGIHGALFLMYFYTLLSISADRRWSRGAIGWGLVASSVPFAAFWFDRHLRTLVKSLDVVVHERE